jgi:hypothetical protein
MVPVSVALDPPRRDAVTSSAVPAVDVVVRWGDWVLAAAELSPPRSFSVGEEGCDVVLPKEIVGAPSAPVLLARWDGDVRLIVAQTARVTLDGKGKRLTAERAIARGKALASTSVRDAAEVTLAPGRTAALHFGPVTIEVTRSEGSPRAQRDPVIGRRLALSHVASLATHALALIALSALGSSVVDEDYQRGITAEQIYELQRRLQAISETEQEDRYTDHLKGYERRARRNERRIEAFLASIREDEWMDSLGGDQAWSGKTIAQAQAQVRGDTQSDDMLGLFYERPVRPVVTAPPPVAISTRPTSYTLPAEPARNSPGPKVRMGAVSVSGRLPPEVVQRIVRQNFGRFRLCYENGLRNNPNLQGRVAVRFVVGRDGAVSNVGNGGSDMPDGGVVSCVVRAFYGLSFPEPERGIVTIVYPIMFSPG